MQARWKLSGDIPSIYKSVCWLLHELKFWGILQIDKIKVRLLAKLQWSRWDHDSLSECLKSIAFMDAMLAVRILFRFYYVYSPTAKGKTMAMYHQHAFMLYRSSNIRDVQGVQNCWVPYWKLLCLASLKSGALMRWIDRMIDDFPDWRHFT